MRGRYVSFVLGSFVFRVVVEFGGVIAFLYRIKVIESAEDLDFDIFGIYGRRLVRF